MNELETVMELAARPNALLTANELLTVRALWHDRVAEWSRETERDLAEHRAAMIELGQSRLEQAWRAFTHRRCALTGEPLTPCPWVFDPTVVYSSQEIPWHLMTADRDAARRRALQTGYVTPRRANPYALWPTATVHSAAEGCAHRVAADANLATVYAGLVDLEPAGHNRYVVVPRDASPDWEYSLGSPHVPKDETPDMPTAEEMADVIDRMTDDAFGHYTFPVFNDDDELIGHETRKITTGTVGNLTPIAPPSMVPYAVVAASAADPSRVHLPTYTLSKATRFIFAEAGISMPAADVMNRNTRRIHSRPDRVAFRGLPRMAQRPGKNGAETSPVRYQTGRKKVAPHRWESTVQADSDGVVRLTTRLVLPLCWVKRKDGKLVRRCADCGKGRARCQCPRKGWRGKQSITFARPKFQVTAAKNDAARTAAKSAKTQSARPIATSTRGPKVKAWSMSERSLSAATFAGDDATDERKQLAAAWRAIDTVLRNADNGSDVELADGTVVTSLGAAQVFDHHRGRAYPVREWARRYALQQASK